MEAGVKVDFPFQTLDN